MTTCPACGMPTAAGIEACPNCGREIPVTPLADRLAVIALLSVLALMFVASAARIGFAIFGSLGLWIGAILGGIAVWAAVDRFRQRSP